MKPDLGKPDSDRHYLTPLFEPASVAILGASARAGAIGTVLLRNMLDSGYRGRLYAVNPGHIAIGGMRCHASIADIEHAVDLAVIATPAAKVPVIIEQCGRAGVRAALVISAGFAETGPAGSELEQAALAHARRHGMRLLGPNCLGLMRPSIGLNATFARNTALPGRLGLVSQSGAVCTALLDWATPGGIGFSAMVSLGASTDLDFGEIIDYLAQDAATEHILLYIEGVRDARRFVSALRAAARVKPVILMKVGRHPSGSRAVKSHTGALVGADSVFDAVIRRTGVVRVQSIGQLVAAAQALTAHMRPQGERLAIITNGGGPGVMAADHATDLGLPLASLSPQTVQALRLALPAHWSQGNPVDLIGDADAGRYLAAATACLADPEVDGLLAILTPQAMTQPTDAARALITAARDQRKPVIACWMGDQAVAASRAQFRKARIPVFSTPEPAVETYGHICAFYRNQRALLQTPGPWSQDEPADPMPARAIIERALMDKRTLLTERESKAVFASFGIAVAAGELARSADEAVLHADRLGYPVVLKIESPDIIHKSDVGGISLNLRDANEVRAAHDRIVASSKRACPDARLSGVNVQAMVEKKNGIELMVGMKRDSVFGPVMSFGAGGTMVEFMRDVVLELPPLNRELAAQLARRSRVFRLLEGYRGRPPADVRAVEDLLLRASEMLCELPWIREFDLNPVLADENGAIALDARMVIAPGPMVDGHYAHLVILPYPAALVRHHRLTDGTEVTIRPIRPEDAELERQFVSGLSADSRYFRFMGALRELTPAMLARFTQIDYDREMALVAIINHNGSPQQIAVARYAANPDGKSCEFAIVVADEWQRLGLARRLMENLAGVAKSRGLVAMVGYVLANNATMLAFCRNLGCDIHEAPGDMPMKRVTLSLAAGKASAV